MEKMPKLVMDAWKLNLTGEHKHIENLSREALLRRYKMALFVISKILPTHMGGSVKTARLESKPRT